MMATLAWDNVKPWDGPQSWDGFFADDYPIVDYARIVLLNQGATLTVGNSRGIADVLLDT